MKFVRPMNVIEDGKGGPSISRKSYCDVACQQQVIPKLLTVVVQGSILATIFISGSIPGLTPPSPETLDNSGRMCARDGRNPESLVLCREYEQRACECRLGTGLVSAAVRGLGNTIGRSTPYTDFRLLVYWVDLFGPLTVRKPTARSSFFFDHNFQETAMGILRVWPGCVRPKADGTT